MFDITMGGYHGAEACELVGLLMLEGISKIIPNENIGLYRDDGLAVVEKMSGQKMEKLKNRLHRFGKSIGLRFTIEGPMDRTDFLDITLDMKKRTYAPFRKMNSETRYISTQSNHPRNIIKEIPKMISKRISNRSKNKEEFEKVESYYNEALQRSGYKEKITFEKEKDNTKKRKRRRRRNIIWYNPPFCHSVKTNLAGKFIRLVDKHFNKQHPLNKIFNKNSLNISYSCMDNMDKIIANHNRKILEPKEKDPKKIKLCCKNKAKCPLNEVGKSCDTENVIYKAYVTTDKDTNTYIGLTSNSFKTRWYGHQESFRNEKSKNKTSLSSYIWELKEKQAQYTIKWDIIKEIRKNSYGTKWCRLCTSEASEIMKNKENPLNKKN